MSHIKGKNTKPELAIRKILFSKGLRYRLHPKDLPGKPDIVFRPSRVAIFVNGCFWHQHKNCKDAFVPSTRKKYWTEKLAKNVQRDRESIDSLKKLGWEVHVIWECYFKDNELIESLVRKIFVSVKRRNSRTGKTARLPSVT